METKIECGLCSAEKFKDLYDETRLWRVHQGQRMVQCADCGLVQILPHTTEVVDYDRDYFIDYSVFEDGTTDNSVRIELFRRRLREICNYVNSGRLLDVGCAKGDFLRLARDEFGWNIVGLEISEWAAEYARSVYNVEVQNTPVTEALFHQEEFDVIHSNHVWEHLPDPLMALQKIHQWLKPGGYLYLELPNEIDNLPWYLDVILGRPRAGGSLFGQRKPRTEPTPHLYFFTRTTLAQLIKKAGFEIVELRTRTDMTWPGTWFKEDFSRQTKFKVTFYQLARIVGQWIGRGSNIVAIAHKPIKPSENWSNKQGS